MIELSNVSFGLAMLAGLASFLSPCVLSLVPAYVGYLSGKTVMADGMVAENRAATFLHGVFFVLGFSLVFIALGAAASAVGQVLYGLRGVLSKVGGLVVIVFGLHTIGVIHIPFLDYDTRRQVAPNAGLGYLSSSLMGIFFSAGWAPCVGPVLGAVLTMALDTASVGRGTILLAGYSVGLAIPFLAAAAGIARVSDWLRRWGKHLRVVSLVTGVMLIIIGVLLLTDSFALLARSGLFVNFGI